MAPEEQPALRSWVCPTTARRARSMQVPAVLMLAHRGRPRTARRSVVERVARLAGPPSRWTQGPQVPPTTEQVEAQEVRVRLEQAPPACPMKAPGPGLEARRQVALPGVAALKELPRWDPVHLHWKATVPVRPKTAMWQVTKRLERPAHPTCPQPVRAQALRPNQARVAKRWSAQPGSLEQKAAPRLPPPQRSDSPELQAGRAGPTSSCACDVS